MRLLIYDKYNKGEKSVGLWWQWFHKLWFPIRRKLVGRRFDAILPAQGDWFDALSWAVGVLGSNKLHHLEYWGHGHWGRVLLNGDALTSYKLESDSDIQQVLADLTAKCVPDTLVWFRTCSTFGNIAGHEFIIRLRNRFKCVLAGHTYSINFFHSGLHTVKQNQIPSWPLLEGVKVKYKGEKRIEKPMWSTPWEPNTATALHTEVPDGW